jgi:glycogen synthase
VFVFFLLGVFEHASRWQMESSMNVLMLSWEFPPKIFGGLGIACFGLSKAITEIRPEVSVTVVLPEVTGGEDRRYVNVIAASDLHSGSRNTIDSDCNRRSASMHDPIIAPASPGVSRDRHFPGQKANTSTSSERAGGGYSRHNKTRVSQFAQLVSANSACCGRFDLIHAHDWLTFEAGLMLKCAYGKPLVAHVHSTEWDRAGEHGDSEIIDIERRGLDGADRIIAVSNFTRRTLIERYQQRPNKISTVYNGIETKVRCGGKRAPSSKKRVSFIGRITRQKAPECFIRAAHRVLQHRHDVEFIMAGDGDLLEMMVRMARSLGLDGVVTFPGFLGRDEVRGLLESSDVYVMPSISEPFGIAALEAIDAGVPVIVSRHAGITEVVRSAPRIDWWDVDAQAEIILDFLNYPERARRSATRCAQEAGSLSWVNAAEMILLQYRDLAG